MRFGIRKKLLLLTVLLSLALILASVFISSRLYSANLNRAKEKSCLDSANGLVERIEKEYNDFLLGYQEKIRALYAENRIELERIEAEVVFDSFDEKEKYFTELTSEVFPPKSGFGLSYDMVVFINDYTSLIQELDLLAYTDGLDSATIFFYDRANENMVYLMDISSDQSLNYHFPASITKPWDERLKQAIERSEPSAFFCGSDCYAVSPIVDKGADEPFAFVCYGSFNSDSQRSTNLFSLYTFGIMLAATAVIAMFVMLFANKLIVKNIKKLSYASERFALGIGGEHLEKISADISSKDEIGALSGKFDLMQDSILGYIASLSEKTAKEEKMKTELELAARIQAESLPSVGLEKGRFVLESFLKPAREVGGDLYDYFMLDEKRMFFCLADVSGKGIPAALFMMRAKELIRSGINSGKPLGEFTYELNNMLCAGNEESIFITAFFGILDTESGELSYLRAGHEQPMLKRAGEIKRIGEESNFVLGVFEDVDFSSDQLTLEEGDTLLLFTDGLNEGINESAEEFGYERIAETFKASRSDIANSLYLALKSFCGSAEQFDDVTLLVLYDRNELRIELEEPSFDDITRVTNAVLAKLQCFDKESVSEVGIIIDEVMNNQISYSFAETASPKSAVALRVFEDQVELVFEDNGKPFDPLSEVRTEDLEASDGGFGIALVKSMSDKQSYEFSDGINRLSVRKGMRERC